MLPANWRERFDGGYEREEPLAPHTTWRIGGPAELYVEPGTVEALSATVGRLWKLGVSYRVLGGGSNLLVSDRGVRGAVFHLDRLRGIERNGSRVVVEAGVPLHGLVRYVAGQGLSGGEPLAGIPGQVGGAIFGNAGGKYGDIGRLVRAVELMNADGTIERVVPDDGFFGYRRSQVGSRLVVRVELELTPAATTVVRAENRRVIRERRDSQPGWVGNAGCVFRNPPGMSAGKLIQEAGLKGARVGGLSVSQRHANFFENVGGGTESDVRRLIDLVRDGVRRAHGVDLEVEVRRWV